MGATPGLLSIRSRGDPRGRDYISEIAFPLFSDCVLPQRTLSVPAEIYSFQPEVEFSPSPEHMKRRNQLISNCCVNRIFFFFLSVEQNVERTRPR